MQINQDLNNSKEDLNQSSLEVKTYKLKKHKNNSDFSINDSKKSFKPLFEINDKEDQILKLIREKNKKTDNPDIVLELTNENIVNLNEDTEIVYQTYTVELSYKRKKIHQKFQNFEDVRENILSKSRKGMLNIKSKSNDKGTTQSLLLSEIDNKLATNNNTNSNNILENKTICEIYSKPTTIHTTNNLNSFAERRKDIISLEQEEKDKETLSYPIKTKEQIIKEIEYHPKTFITPIFNNYPDKEKEKENKPANNLSAGSENPFAKYVTNNIEFSKDNPFTSIFSKPKQSTNSIFGNSNVNGVDYKTTVLFDKNTTHNQNDNNPFKSITGSVTTNSIFGNPFASLQTQNNSIPFTKNNIADEDNDGNDDEMFNPEEEINILKEAENNSKMKDCFSEVKNEFETIEKLNLDKIIVSVLGNNSADSKMTLEGSLLTFEQKDNLKVVVYRNKAGTVLFSGKCLSKKSELLLHQNKNGTYMIVIQGLIDLKEFNGSKFNFKCVKFKISSEEEGNNFIENHLNFINN